MEKKSKQIITCELRTRTTAEVGVGGGERTRNKSQGEKKNKVVMNCEL